MLRLVETPSQQEFCAQATEFLMGKIQAAQRAYGTCIVGLSGGATPKPVYEELRKRLHRPPLPNPPPEGEGISFFLVDERYVPKDHPDSNQRLVRETLLTACHAKPVEAHNLVFPNAALPIDACVADYVQRLQKLWKGHVPDLIVLGMGTDGHIASLFPPLSDLALGNECPVLHTRAPEGIRSPSARDRISLSLGALSSAKEHVLLLQGKEKRQTWEEMIASPEGVRRWPLKRIIETGNLTVFT